MPLICDEANLLPLLLRFFKYDESEQVRYDAAVVLYYCLGHEPAQKALCRAGAIKMLSDLALDRVKESERSVVQPTSVAQQPDAKC